MRVIRISYYLALGLFTALMLFSAVNYFINYGAIKEGFTTLGFPTYLIYPLAGAKLLGLVAIWTKRSIVLKEWAYAGYVFNTLLAASAHLNADDGQAGGAFTALLLILTTYFLEKKLFPQKTVGRAIHARPLV